MLNELIINEKISEPTQIQTKKQKVSLDDNNIDSLLHKLPNAVHSENKNIEKNNQISLEHMLEELRK